MKNQHIYKHTHTYSLCIYIYTYVKSINILLQTTFLIDIENTLPTVTELLKAPLAVPWLLHTQVPPGAELSHLATWGSRKWLAQVGSDSRGDGKLPCLETFRISGWSTGQWLMANSGYWWIWSTTGNKYQLVSSSTNNDTNIDAAAPHRTMAWWAVTAVICK